MTNQKIDREFLDNLYEQISTLKIVDSEAAIKQGYKVDKTCYPWIAYKGDKNNPDESIKIITDTEKNLVSMVDQMADKMNQASFTLKEQGKIIESQKTIIANYRKTVETLRSTIQVANKTIRFLKGKLKGK